MNKLRVMNQNNFLYPNFSRSITTTSSFSPSETELNLTTTPELDSEAITEDSEIIETTKEKKTRRKRKSTPKPPKIFDPSTFDPINNPNEASAIYTNLGWFFIPKHLHLTDQEPRSSINRFFSLKNFKKNQTPQNIIQDSIINEWCPSYEPEKIPIKLKRKEIKSIEEMKIRKNLFKEQMLEINLDEIKKKLQSQQSQAKKSDDKVSTIKSKKPSREETKLRFKIDPETGKVEIKGNLNLKHIWLYYQSKQLIKFPNLTKTEITKMWKKISDKDKSRYYEEYKNLLLSGKDYYNGKIVTLESRLSFQIEKDGFQARKNRNEIILENRAKRMENQIKKSKE
ncbi:uncharacterized protein KGF55_002961 [Candida pseudojiufengensis]|uniref:uncharacterized protein n=1 Tax=Candida pseudojiufengensis TaxID=497109 RepID=UPI0022247C8E|nr:uncharacterized protein KGF55_002961 [Candida pseudojiufengensis]KAI5963169.1 hypothetical protein KGF55_002961 [Candida pseudojiufengensis]